MNNITVDGFLTFVWAMCMIISIPFVPLACAFGLKGILDFIRGNIG